MTTEEPKWRENENTEEHEKSHKILVVEGIY